LVQHVHGAAVHGNIEFHHARKRSAVKQIGREHDVCVPVVKARRKTTSQRAFDFTQRHRVHHYALSLHEAKDVCIGVGFLSETHYVKKPQSGNLARNGVCIVDPQRGTELLGQRSDGSGRKRVHRWMIPFIVNSINAIFVIVAIQY
jgi:hypothetical protein